MEAPTVDDSNDPRLGTDPSDERRTGMAESILDEDAMFEALAHERRRYLLYSLLDDEAWTLEELATKVAAWELGVSAEDVDGGDVERVYASLFHAHVPKLVDLDILEFDRRTETITSGSNAEKVLNVLELTGESDAIELESHARGGEDE